MPRKGLAACFSSWQGSGLQLACSQCLTAAPQPTASLLFTPCPGLQGFASGGSGVWDQALHIALYLWIILVRCPCYYAIFPQSVWLFVSWRCPESTPPSASDCGLSDWSEPQFCLGFWVALAMFWSCLLQSVPISCGWFLWTFCREPCMSWRDTASVKGIKSRSNFRRA